MTQPIETTDVNTIQQINGALGTLSAAVLPSLVEVRSRHRGRYRGTGAGTIWHKDGLIATNAHVVRSPGRGRGRSHRRGRADHSDISVRLHDGSEHEARVVAHDDALDLAFLRFDVPADAPDLPVIELGDSQALTPGDMVVAFGHPWGVMGAATSGIVIGMGDRLPELASSGREWLAASLHLRPGHSGGPMVDSTGRLVGINTLMNGPDVGVAVPVHVARHFLQETVEERSAPPAGPTSPTYYV